MKLDLAARTSALAEAVASATGRLDQQMLDEANSVIARAGERANLSAEHTVVALAGATGSGKSSLFNAIAGVQAATAGIRRPTTSQAMACIWGDAADPLLDWLEVPTRRIMPAVAETPSRPQRGGLRGLRHKPATVLTSGLVLLDLPDHDSVVLDNRMRAVKLVERADLLVWVVDPQKYADAALHDGFLKPLAGRSDVVVVALNQIDRLSEADESAMRADLVRLVAEDGLSGARVLGVSAKTGQGIDSLRGLLDQAASRREASTARLVLDTRAAAERLIEAAGRGSTPKVDARAKRALVDSLGDAAGLSTVVDATYQSTMREARRLTGWPLTRWMSRLRPDPLRRLGLRPDSRVRGSLARTSLPRPTAAASAAAATAVRRYADAATSGAPEPWVLAARARAATAIEAMPDALDQAVVATNAEAGRRPLWWRAVGAAQWALLAAAVAGGLWLLAAFLVGYLRLPDLPIPALSLSQDFEIPWATLLAVGGALAGLLLAGASRLLARLSARRRARAVDGRLRESISQAADRLVCAPVDEELASLAQVRTAAARAASR